MKCNHDDCLTCPYPDCISKNGPVHAEKRKPGRKKLPVAVKAQNRKRWQQDYYQKNKEIKQAYSREYYATHNAEIKQKVREKRLSKVIYPNSRIWITNGEDNKRIRASNLASYEQKGWKRGRTLKPYIYKEIV